MKYGKLSRRKTMQKLYLGKGNERTQHGKVLLAQLRRLRTLRSMCTVRRYSMLLVTQTEWPKSGTVVPHCDFQKVIREIGLYKGIFLYTHSRSACMRAPPHKMTLAAKQLARLHLYYFLQIGRTYKPQAVSLKNGSFSYKNVTL
jgi:hypothetical protein